MNQKRYEYEIKLVRCGVPQINRLKRISALSGKSIQLVLKDLIDDEYDRIKELIK